MSPLTLQTINNIDLASYLAFLGHQPQKISGAHYWYRSPFSKHVTDKAHFHVNRRTNRWYDLDLGIGSTTLDLDQSIGSTPADFGLRYFPDARAFAESLHEFLLIPKTKVPQPAVTITPTPPPIIELLETHPISSLVLIQYLWERHIPLSVARHYCVEAWFTRDQRQYHALAFPTDAGGYQLCHKFHQYCIGQQSPSSIIRQSDELIVFLDCFDLMSLPNLAPVHHQRPDLLAINHADSLAPVLPRIKTYTTVRLFLPNTTAGNKLTATIREEVPAAIDYRPLYSRYSSLNHWICHFGKGTPPPHPTMSQSPS